MSDAPYEFLTPETTAAYIKSVPKIADKIDADDIVSVEEVGDGNLNLVFIIKDGAGRGVVLKQALPYVRLVGPDWPMTPDRARHEAEALRQHSDLVPEFVVDLYSYDGERYLMAMEDLSDHMVWRGALNEGLRHDGAAAAMGKYVGAVAFGTSCLGMERTDLAKRLAASVNPDLCTITEDLVFTEPYVDAGRNSVLAANERDARELADDDVMVAEMGQAKWTFMTRAEALIHGDLHTGSVMVKTDDPSGSGEASSVKAFDPEFAFYGPVSFDLGALYANYLIAAARAHALNNGEHMRWALELPEQTWAAFESEFRQKWPSRVDPRVYRDDLLESLLARWRTEAWAFGAAKMARRIVGLAKTTDIETLDESVREGAARAVLQAARLMVRERHNNSDPARLIEIVGNVFDQVGS